MSRRRPPAPGAPGDVPPAMALRPRAMLISAVRDPSAPPLHPAPAATAPPAGRLPDASGAARAAGAGASRAAAAGAPDLPLPALLSQLLIAFTVECDNEFEHRMEHRTTRGPAARSRRGPWLISLPMWANFLQFLPAEGSCLRDVDQAARLTNLAGLERWGYVTVQPDPADPRPAPPRRDWIVGPTAAGRRAQQTWRPLPAVIEDRWRQRFGAGEIAGLRESLLALLGQIGLPLPRYLPVVSYADGMRAPRGPFEGPPAAFPAGEDDGSPDLSVLLSRLLLAFTIEYESESALSLAISANVLRVLAGDGVLIRDLPRLSGVSKEAVSASTGFLERHGYVATEPDPAGRRARIGRLTSRGQRALDSCRRLAGAVEESWTARFGSGSIRALRQSTLRLYGQRTDGQPRLAGGLAPYPDGWRAHPPYLAQTTAMIRDPVSGLPRYPVVSHRGGYPDGS